MTYFAGTILGTDVNFTAYSGLALVALAVLAFEIWMLVDVINNKKIHTDQKVWWVIGMFLLHPFVSAAYFIVTRLGSKK